MTPTETLVLKVGGMTCAGCARTVERSASAVPGVASARVDLPFHRLTVTYDPARAAPGAVADAVKGAGYDVLP